MCITGLVFLLLTVTASMVSYPVHLVSMAFSFTTLPPDVPARVLLLLGATVGPVLCATASSIASSTDVAAVLGQLRAAVHVLRFPMDIPGRGWSVTRQYGACCKAVAHAVRLPLRAMENRRMFWPGFNELAPARVCFLGCRSIDEPVTMQHRALNLPLNITPFDLSDHLAMNLGLSADPLTALLELNDDDPQLQQILGASCRVLRAGVYAFKFYPADFEFGLAAHIVISFASFGVIGAIAAAEPEVDPAGFYVW